MCSMKRNEKSNPSLLHAAASGTLADVTALVEHGADVNALDSYARSALMFAVSRGDMAIVKYLIEQGANVNASDKDEGNSNTEGTALRRAVSEGHLDIVKLLLDQGADVDGRSPRGSSPLQRAASNNHLVIAQLLLDHNADPNILDENGAIKVTALSHAAFNVYLDMTVLLLRHGTLPSPTDFIYAGSTRKSLPEDQIAVLRLLLAYGADVNAEDEYTDEYTDESGQKHSWTALQCVARSGWGDSPEVVKFLLDSGADVNAQSKDGGTALIYAAREGRISVVQLLLDSGANPAFSDNEGRTALSVSVEHDREDVHKLLIDYKN